MKRPATIRAACLAALLALAASFLPAANISVDRLELLSHGVVDPADLRFSVDSRLYFGLVLEGGSKFTGLLRMDFLSGGIENALSEWGSPLPTTPTPEQVADRLNEAASPRLRTVAVTARRLLGLPLELSYFVGNMGSFCSGDDYPGLFGSAPFATELRGPMVYPSGVGGNPDLFYDGIHTVYGTGAMLGTAGLDRAVLRLYAYQDADLEPGDWSADLRALGVFGGVNLELFAGASFPAAHALGLYRGGLLFHYAPGDIGEFFAQVGVPTWDPTTAMGAEALFFLFEPRINFGAGTLALTVFYHPAWYRQKATNENGNMDVAVDFRFGRLATSGATGGISGMIALRPQDSDPLSISVSPHYAVITSGVQWDFKLAIQAFPIRSVWYAMFEPFIGVKTSF